VVFLVALAQNMKFLSIFSNLRVLVSEFFSRFGPYRSTLELAEVICSVKGSDDRGMHPAKMTFQAIRSYLNKDMKFHWLKVWSSQGFEAG